MNIIIDENQESQRIDIFLIDYMPNFSRSKIQNEIKKETILVNNKPIKSSYILKEGDTIKIKDCEINEPEILAEKISLNVVWEDENMAVINKPSGMLTHPTTIETSGTLVNALLYLYNDNLSDINGDMRRGIVHRLDRNTSGLIMIAKNNQTHEFLVEEMKKKKFYKKIYCYCKRYC